MKLRTPIRLKLRPSSTHLKLEDSSLCSVGPGAENSDETEEHTSLQLSYTFFVVLILHILLIGGIFGFNYVKVRKIPPTNSSLTVSTQVSERAKVACKQGQFTRSTPFSFERSIESNGKQPLSSVILTPTTDQFIAANGRQALNQHNVPSVIMPSVPKGGRSFSIVQQSNRHQAAAKRNNLLPQELVHSHQERMRSNKVSYKTYVVAEGDNPYSIARRLKASYSDLISLNNIQDPTKLQIGTKLKIPTGRE